MSSSCYSPSRGSPNPARRQFGPGFSSLSRLRCSSMRKPPEPLRRAVADCLSSSSATFQQGGPSSEASRTLRVAFQWQDHLASPATTNLAYSVILEHTTAERERSPAVVPRCVALLKRHLLRYKPSEEILLQIDRFCVHIIAEWDVNPSRTFSPRSRSLNQQNGAPTTSANLSPVPASSFASGALVKSLNYVRSLVALHIPKLSFQPVAFAGSHSISRHALPRLSSLLSRSFSNQLAPVNASGSSENKDVMPVSPSNLENLENVDGREDLEYIVIDVLKWRWLEGNQSSFLSTERDLDTTLPETNTSNFLEVGAAALLVGDMETKINGLPRKCFGTADMPYLDQLLEPSPVTALTNSASACSHLKAITAAKRTKPGPREIWDDSHVSTFRPRARQLFQYRYYSEQQPLRLSPVEVHEVIAAVCSETSIPVANFMTVSSKLSNNGGKQPMDVAVSVLIKLVIDMYVQNSGTAAPLTLSMLEEMLKSPRTDCRTRAFDLILNLGVHAHLLEPIVSDDSTIIEEEYRRDTFFDSEAQVTSQGKIRVDSFKNIDVSSAIDDFEAWILDILYAALLLLVQIEEEDESVWASALSCLLYFVCDRGKISRHHLNGLDIRVIRVLILVGRKHSWAEVLHCKLNCILTNMFYQVPEEPDKDSPIAPKFLIDQFDLIGGVEFIYCEYFRTKSREERRNLFAVLFDYVLHRINEERIATGVSEYSDEEIQPLATLFALADASEAFYISIKLGVEGIDEILGRSISAALASYSINERLNMLLENITEKFDTLIKSCTYLDKEFSYLKQITQSYKFFESNEDAVLRSGVGMTVKLSWVTLHSLLHSERFIYRIHGYIWLSDLLIDEIRKEKDSSTVSSIKILQQTIAHAGALEHSISSDVPLPICLLCGLLKSKNTFIRYGFLAILEKLLTRCKFLLDENESLQLSDIDSRQKHEDSRLEKANTMIDIMSSVLSLMAQMNETKRVNILKMCDILFSQLCLKVLPGTATPRVDGVQTSKVLTHTAGVKTNDSNLTVQDKWCLDEFMDENDSPYSYPNSSLSISKTTSMAALLLRGQAIVPRQLVARVPAALLYWPLIQLASAATDNIALGVAVGSKGRGNLPGATSDIRATLLLLLIGKCSADPAAFQEVGGDDFFKELLDDTDSRVAYYSSSFLLKRMMTEKPENYQNMLQKLIFRAQQSNNEKLLENPYLQMRGILQLSNDLGTGLI